MMKEEFEKLAGYEVSDSDYYNIIEKMYMAVDLNKAEFVKTIDKKRFALKPVKTIIKDMKKAAESLKDTCNHFTDWETKESLEASAKEYISRNGWAGLVGFMFNDTMTSQKCYYTESISFYSLKDYRNIEVLQLTK